MLDRMCPSAGSAPATSSSSSRRISSGGVLTRGSKYALLLKSLIVISLVGWVSARSHNRGGRAQEEVILCKDVHSRCFARDGCRSALEYYVMACMTLTEEEQYDCTEQCRNALIMLLSSDEHDGPAAFRDCDCMDDEFCLKQRERMMVCEDDVQSWLDDINNPNTPISCSLASLVCSADTPCLTAIDYYHDHCKKLIESRNPRCTSRCNNSLDILYRQPKAQKLRTCYCDGTELYNCTALKDNTRNLCYGMNPRPSYETSTRIRHPDTHDHTRGCRTHNIPPPTASVKTSIDSAVPEQPQQEPSSHNSAYTLHSRASGGPVCLTRTQWTQFLLTLLGVLTWFARR